MFNTLCLLMFVGQTYIMPFHLLSSLLGSIGVFFIEFRLFHPVEQMNMLHWFYAGFYGDNALFGLFCIIILWLTINKFSG